MAISAYIPAAEQPETQTHLLEETLNSTVDYKGRPAKKPSSGRWRSASFLIGKVAADSGMVARILASKLSYVNQYSKNKKKSLLVNNPSKELVRRNTQVDSVIVHGAAAEVAERFAYYGISSNLITYLTGPLGFPTASAAENVNARLGTDLLLPFIGAFVADSFLGCYRTIVVSSVIYVVVIHLFV